MPYYLEMNEVSKTYPNGVKALMGACLRVSEGEIHALIGENAAGKTTLMNILYGIHSPDEGSILLSGRKVQINHPGDAIKFGIGMVHQHFKLVSEFTILENILLGREKNYTNRFGKIDYQKVRRDVESLLRNIDLDLDLDAKIDTVSIGIRSKVEIVKTLFRGARLIILDEPTTVLAPTEVSSFFTFLRSLRDSGCTIIYISHRLQEILDLSDTITVLKQGRDVARVETKNASTEDIARLMLGYEPSLLHYNNIESRGDEDSETVLSLEDLFIRGSHIHLQGINLTVQAKEVVGIAGIGGNGQAELADTLIGILQHDSGKIFIIDTDASHLTIKDRRELGLTYIPDDRISKGIALDSTITDNAVVGHEDQLAYGPGRRWLNWKKAREFTRILVNEYGVEGMARPEQKAGNLSGGNIQKLIVGREMIDEPKIVILSQPTAGVDFNAQKNIHKKILDLKEKGTAFVLISEDMDELMNLSDRIFVMYRGRLTKEFVGRDQYDEIEIGKYMTGIKGQ